MKILIVEDNRKVAQALRKGLEIERYDAGAGLGLAIARLAVEANGGRIELESEENHGGTFRIVLTI